jgi:hypothetical protein
MFTKLTATLFFKREIYPLALKLSLSLPLCLIYMLTPTVPTVADPLKGQVEDEEVAPAKPSQDSNQPLMPMVSPVLKTPAPSFSSEAAKSDDKDASLQGQVRGDVMDGKSDWMEDGLKPQTAKVAPVGGVLKGAAQVEDGEVGGADLGSADPDMQDQELQVEWDRWRNRFLRAVLAGATETMNNPQEVNFRWDPARQAMVSPFPLGLECMFSCVVANDRTITKFKIEQSSGNPAFDRSVAEAVRALEGTAILRFPARSRRKVVLQAGGIKTADHTENRYYHFGDVERYRTPGY